MIHTVQLKNKNEDGDMKHSWSLFRGQWADPSAAKQATATHTAGRLRALNPAVGQHLTLEDEKAYIRAGYNPYDTVVHVKDSRIRDVWQNKPKRD